MCDFVIGGVAYLDPKWTRLIKLSDGYLQRPNAYIIPMPTVTISAFNVFRPFQWQVNLINFFFISKLC